MKTVQYFLPLLVLLILSQSQARPGRLLDKLKNHVDRVGSLLDPFGLLHDDNGNRAVANANAESTNLNNQFNLGPLGFSTSLSHASSSAIADAQNGGVASASADAKASGYGNAQASANANANSGSSANAKSNAFANGGVFNNDGYNQGHNQGGYENSGVRGSSGGFGGFNGFGNSGGYGNSETGNTGVYGGGLNSASSYSNSNVNNGMTHTSTKTHTQGQGQADADANAQGQGEAGYFGGQIDNQSGKSSDGNYGYEEDSSNAIEPPANNQFNGNAEKKELGSSSNAHAASTASASSNTNNANIELRPISGPPPPTPPQNNQNNGNVRSQNDWSRSLNKNNNIRQVEMQSGSSPSNVNAAASATASGDTSNANMNFQPISEQPGMEYVGPQPSNNKDDTHFPAPNGYDHPPVKYNQPEERTYIPQSELKPAKLSASANTVASATVTAEINNHNMNFRPITEQPSTDYALPPPSNNQNNGYVARPNDWAQPSNENTNIPKVPMQSMSSSSKANAAASATLSTGTNNANINFRPIEQPVMHYGGPLPSNNQDNTQMLAPSAYDRSRVTNNPPMQQTSTNSAAAASASANTYNIHNPGNRHTDYRPLIQYKTLAKPIKTNNNQIVAGNLNGRIDHQHPLVLNQPNENINSPYYVARPTDSSSNNNSVAAANTNNNIVLRPSGRNPPGGYGSSFANANSAASAAANTNTGSQSWPYDRKTIVYGSPPRNPKMNNPMTYPMRPNSPSSNDMKIHLTPSAQPSGNLANNNGQPTLTFSVVETPQPPSRRPIGHFDETIQVIHLDGPSRGYSGSQFQGSEKPESTGSIMIPIYFVDTPQNQRSHRPYYRPQYPQQQRPRYPYQYPQTIPNRPKIEPVGVYIIEETQLNNTPVIGNNQRIPQTADNTYNSGSYGNVQPQYQANPFLNPDKAGAGAISNAGYGYGSGQYGRNPVSNGGYNGGATSGSSANANANAHSQSGNGFTVLKGNPVNYGAEGVYNAGGFGGSTGNAGSVGDGHPSSESIGPIGHNNYGGANGIAGAGAAANSNANSNIQSDNGYTVLKGNSVHQGANGAHNTEGYYGNAGTINNGYGGSGGSPQPINYPGSNKNTGAGATANANANANSQSGDGYTILKENPAFHGESYGGLGGNSEPINYLGSNGNAGAGAIANANANANGNTQPNVDYTILKGNSVHQDVGGIHNAGNTGESSGSYGASQGSQFGSVPLGGSGNSKADAIANAVATASANAGTKGSLGNFENGNNVPSGYGFGQGLSGSQGGSNASAIANANANASGYGRGGASANANASATANAQSGGNSQSSATANANASFDTRSGLVFSD